MFLTTSQSKELSLILLIIVLFLLFHLANIYRHDCLNINFNYDFIKNLTKRLDSYLESVYAISMEQHGFWIERPTSTACRILISDVKRALATLRNFGLESNFGLLAQEHYYAHADQDVRMNVFNLYGATKENIVTINNGVTKLLFCTDNWPCSKG